MERLGPVLDLGVCYKLYEKIWAHVLLVTGTYIQRVMHVVNCLTDPDVPDHNSL